MFSKMSNITTEVVLTRCTDDSRGSKVYEATFDGKLVVIKFGFTKKRRHSVKREAKLYSSKLQKLQYPYSMDFIAGY